MIYVNLITTVIKTIVVDKNNEALLSYRPSYYSSKIYFKNWTD